MSRVFWDTMLLIYLLEGNPAFRPRAEALLSRSRRRGDSLFTSYLAAGEVMAGAERFDQPLKATAIRKTLEEIGFHFLPFDAGAMQPFSLLRAREKLKVADAAHLACAASAGIDLYLTGDTQLFRLDVPGIQFIADFNSSIF
jgi:predicted nucleic acid-binding protein